MSEWWKFWMKWVREHCCMTILKYTKELTQFSIQNLAYLTTKYLFFGFTLSFTLSENKYTIQVSILRTKPWECEGTLTLAFFEKAKFSSISFLTNFHFKEMTVIDYWHLHRLHQHSQYLNRSSMHFKICTSRSLNQEKCFCFKRSNAVPLKTCSSVTNLNRKFFYIDFKLT